MPVRSRPPAPPPPLTGTARFFDDGHYRGYPAVLVRLDGVEEAELAVLLAEAWRLSAPGALVKRHGTGV